MSDMEHSRKAMESLATAVLVQRLESGRYTDEVVQMMRDELEARGITAGRQAGIRQRIEVVAAEKSRLASRGARLVAQLIDTATMFLIVAVGAMLATWFNREGMAVGGGFAGVVYLVLCDGLPGGQSIGKKMLGIAVIDVNTGKLCGYGGSLIRNITLAVLGPLDCLLIFGEKRRRLGDHIANTMVVRTR